MQTFLPYPSFEQSAHCLDMRRLGKQRVECLQLLNTLSGKTSSWKNHPAVLMWRGHEQSLIKYGIVICHEWIMRGYKDTCLNKIQSFQEQFSISNDPTWLGNYNFHAAHRSNLLRKNLEWYNKFGWIEPNDLPYIWGEEIKII
jgi:hypothetical protein